MNKIAAFMTAAFTLQIGAAYAIDHPQMREGLWQIRTQSISNPGNQKTEGTVEVCRDHASDKKAEALAKTVKGCTYMSENFTAGKYTAEVVCKVGSTTITSKGVATYQTDNSVHTETHVTYTPSFAGTTDEVMIQDQTYQGSCPAGMHPGDRRLQPH